ncbi:hypothetical protein LCGC14_1228310 [marine sediment metagenome]|uniref:site-specific DNA-methyltransferase (adenine-specific) n=1 Tax=marine sediment metagenome TaxID=412755 RepID=A0A0F9LDB9_9ZZZZ
MVIKNIDSNLNSSIGQIFTPSYIAEFMVKNLFNFIEKNKSQNLRVLEPSVGEGIFLKYLIENGLENIIAFEIDHHLKVNLLSAYPNITFKFENFLGCDPNEKFDIIIGNPPYLGQNYNSRIFQEYVRKFDICAKYFVGNMDLFYYFIHLGIDKLKPGGLLSFITTNYWVTKSKKTGIKHLKPHILNECFLLQYIDLSALKLFEGAKGQHNCIFILQKKTEEEKNSEKNKSIEVIQAVEKQKYNQIENSSNNEIIIKLSQIKNSIYVRNYTSALTNNHLKANDCWNLLFPIEVQKIIDKIENRCRINDKITWLNDWFIIRNGLILIKDSIFILKEGETLKIKESDFYVKINKKYVKISEVEKKRLKRVYKSKSIRQYGYNKNEHTGYLIYFNKREFHPFASLRRNQYFEEKYPQLTKYLLQFKEELKKTLINAKENPYDIYFPRRGALIRRTNKNLTGELVDLEPLYDSHEKIFLKFISEANIFGYSDEQYYATSDTYFLWPKVNEKIEYLFILAYLNSKLVDFIFKAKNIKIKRSKTKLEFALPIPSKLIFKTKEEFSIVELIEEISYIMARLSNAEDSLHEGITINSIINSTYFHWTKDSQLKARIIGAIKNHDKKTIQVILNQLFFQLFDLNETEINYLLKRYYTL